MNFDKEFNPGENNHYIEIHFGANSQYLPNVTELTIINGDGQDRMTRITPMNVHINHVNEPMPTKDLSAVKTEVLHYISRIAPKLKPELMQSWERFWRGLLDLDAIENLISDTTKQQGTTFNRMLVCKILRYLNDKGFYQAPYNASDMTRTLEGDSQHSIRTHGLNTCPDESLCHRIDRYIETFRE